MRLRHADTILVLLAVACLCFGAFGVTSNIRLFGRASQNVSGETFAQLESWENDVRYKAASLPFWEPVARALALTRGDSVFADKRSSAEIVLRDGVRLRVESDSLAVVDERSSELSVELLRGEVNFVFEDGKAQKIHLRRKDGSALAVNLKPHTNLQVAAVSDKDMALTVHQGVTEIEDGSKKKSLEENQILKTDNATGSVKIEQASLGLEIPAHGQVIYGTGERSVDFSWTTQGPVTKQLLEISDDRTFSKLVASLDVTGRQNTQVRLGAEGTYHWRLKGQGSSGVTTVSPSRDLLFKKDLPVNLRSPNAGESIRIFEALPEDVKFREEAEKSSRVIGDSAVVELSWDPLSDVTGYEIQVGSDPDLKNPILSRQEKETFVRVQLKPGTTYWRVRALSLERPERPWSESRAVRVERVALPLVADARELAAVSPRRMKHGESIDLQWARAAGADGYEIEVTKGRDFKNPLLSDKTRSELYSWTAPTTGEFNWRVRPRDPFGRLTPFVATGTVEVLALPPEIVSPKTGSTIEVSFDQPTVKFVAGAGEHEGTMFLELSASADFSEKIVNSAFKGQEFDWTVSRLGKFYSRIRVQDGAKATTFSDVVSFEVKAPRPKAPNMKNQEKKLDLKFRKPASQKGANGTGILDLLIPPAYAEDELVRWTDLTWEVVVGAKQYHIQVAWDKDFKHIAFEKTLPDTKYRWENVRPGWYYFRVAILDQFGQQSDFSKAIEIQVGFGGSRLRLLAPALNSVVDIKTDDAELNFQWSADSQADRYELQISQDKEFSSLDLTQEFKKTKSDGIHLKPGSYFWKVLPIFPTGNRGQASDSGAFTVRRIEVKPRLLSPAQDDVVVVEESKTEETLEKITLEWSKPDVPGSFEVWISATTNFDKATVIKDLTEAQYNFAPTFENVHFWKVVHVQKKERVQSDVGSFTVKWINRPFEIGAAVRTFIGSALMDKGARMHRSVGLEGQAMLYQRMHGQWRLGLRGYLGALTFMGYDFSSSTVDDTKINGAHLEVGPTTQYMLWQTGPRSGLSFHTTIGISSLVGKFSSVGASFQWGLGYVFSFGGGIRWSIEGHAFHFVSHKKGTALETYNVLVDPSRKFRNNVIMIGMGLAFYYSF